jgi:putative aldouronate transport system permease protein
MKTKSFSDKSVAFISHFCVLVFSLICLYPLLLTLMVSISDENRVQIHGFRLVPEKLSLDTYKYLWERASDNILNAYGVTTLVTVAGTLFAMAVTSMLAYTLSQKSVRHRDKISFFCYLTVIFSAGMLPWYIVCVNVMHIQNTIFALFVPYTVNVWNLFLLRNYFQSIPDAVIESAKMDGANQFMIFYRFVVPLSKTAVLTVGLFYAIQFWNDWWLSIMLITNSKLFPLQFYLFSLLTSAQALSSGQTMNASNISIPTETIKMATTMITMGPVILLFPMVQKYFVRGIMIGAVKG